MLHLQDESFDIENQIDDDQSEVDSLEVHFEYIEINTDYKIFNIIESFYFTGTFLFISMMLWLICLNSEYLLSACCPLLIEGLLFVQFFSKISSKDS